MAQLAGAELQTHALFTEFNLRQEEERPHFIRLYDQVVDGIEPELSEGDWGILLGSVEAAESSTIHIESFEPSSRRLRDNKRVMGCYRAQRGADFEIGPADLACFQEWFPGGAGLMLLLKRPKVGPWTGMFFLGENGALSADRATVEFPFNLRSLGAAEPPPKLVVAPVGKKAVPPRSSWKKALIPLVAIALAVAGFQFRHSAQAPVPPAAPPAAIEQPEPVLLQAPETPAIPAVSPSKATAEPTPSLPQAAPPKPEPHPAARAQDQTAPASSTPSPVTIPAPPAQTSTAPTMPPATVTTPVAVPPPAPPVATLPATKPPEAAEPTLPYMAPRMIRQYAPVVKESIRRSIPGEMTIRLRVFVDSSGKVTGADPLNATTKIGDSLADAAITSVKRWQFEPARRGDRKVPGEIELTFTFRTSRK